MVGGSLRPRDEGGAARRPFSTADVARKTRVLMLFTISSTSACDCELACGKLLREERAE